MGAHGWVAGIANHGSVLLSRGWLITVEAPGQCRHPPFTQLDATIVKYTVNRNNSVIINFAYQHNKINVIKFTKAQHFTLYEGGESMSYHREVKLENSPHLALVTCSTYSICKVILAISPSFLF